MLGHFKYQYNSGEGEGEAPKSVTQKHRLKARSSVKKKPKKLSVAAIKMQ